jgi:uncharacterized damage-inducible protein DinB
MTTEMLQLWQEGRSRFSNLLEQVKEEDLPKKLGEAPNSIGFLIRHIAEVELLFAKNVFQNPDVKVIAKTVIDGKDTGVWTNLDELKAIAEESFQTLKSTIESQSEDSWNDQVTTKEFGTKTKAEALARVTTHAAYHAGQMSIILKYA